VVPPAFAALHRSFRRFTAHLDRSPGVTALAVGLLLASGSGCAPRERGDAEADAPLAAARVALGASFVGGRASGLRALLHADLIVQPPEPDSAHRGAAAADYLERLARESEVARSELVPTAMAREGDFLLERGTWFLESGGRTLRSRYTLRWREASQGWQVVLWRWTLFR
jgi:hypothetical protein